MDHPPLLSPPIGPLPGLDLGPMGGPPMPFDPLFPPHFMGPGGFMPPPPPPDGSMMPPLFGMPPPLPPSGLMADLRPPPLGMIATGSFDVDYRRDLTDAPMSMPGRYPSPPRRYTASPLGSERSGRSDRSDNHYDDRYRPISPMYGGRHGVRDAHGGRPRSVGRSRDPSPDRPRSYSPLPSPLYPNHGTVHSPMDDDWNVDNRGFRPQIGGTRSGSLRHPPGPKTSSPLTHTTMESGGGGDGGRHHHRQLPLH